MRFLLLFLLWLCVGTCHADETGTVPLGEYVTRLQALRDSLKGEKPASVRDAASARFAAVKAVQMPSGDIIKPNLAPLNALVREAGAGKSQAETAGNAITHAILLATPNRETQSGIAGRAADEARKILSAPEFVDAAKKKAQKKSWIERQIENALKALAEWFQNLMGRMQPGAAGLVGMGEILKWTFFFIIAVAGGVAVYFLTRTAMGQVRGRKRRAGSTRNGDLDDGEVGDPLVRARELAAQGDTRQAVRLAYIASLRRLRETGLLVLEPNKTNWEYQRALRGRSPQAYDALLPATRIFDRVWYGFLPTRRADFDRVMQAYESLPTTVRDAETGKTS